MKNQLKLFNSDILCRTGGSGLGDVTVDSTVISEATVTSLVDTLSTA